MGYSSPRALEMAIKDAAKASPLDTNRAIAGFYFHRLLYRVFSEPGTPFVLKGGQGMLARTADALGCALDLQGTAGSRSLRLGSGVVEPCRVCVGGRHRAGCTKMRTAAGIGMPPSAGDVFPGIRFVWARHAYERINGRQPESLSNRLEQRVAVSIK